MDTFKMDSFVPPQSWVSGALALVLAAFGWAFKREVKRVDNIEEREKSYVLREEMQAQLDKRDATLATMHSQNLENFRELRLQNETANGRLFDIAKNMVPRV